MAENKELKPRRKVQIVNSKSIEHFENNNDSDVSVPEMKSDKSLNPKQRLSKAKKNLK